MVLPPGENHDLILTASYRGRTRIRSEEDESRKISQEEGKNIQVGIP
jgi:hypothetical protein